MKQNENDGEHGSAMHDDSFFAVNKGASVEQGFLTEVYAFGSLVYALVVRDLRTEHKNAALGILISAAQPVVMGLIFYGFMVLMGGRGGHIRGDSLTFVVIGFIIFFTHIRTVTAVAGSLRQDMLNHQRLTPFLMISVKAISALYKNVFALIILLIANYLLRDVYELQDPLLFISVLFWCWLGGIAAGTIFLALDRYLSWGGVLSTTYVRIMFFTSGKFFVASKIGGTIRPYFDWNPLFHLLDQGRGAIFLNYGARTTSMSYAITVVLMLLVVGFLTESYVRRHYNVSHAPGG